MVPTLIASFYGMNVDVHVDALGFNIATPVFDGADEHDIMDTLELANDYVNLEWDEFKKLLHRYG